jgi:hypothetical protein
MTRAKNLSRPPVLIAPDIVLGDSCIEGKEAFNASGFRKNIGGMD